MKKWLIVVLLAACMASSCVSTGRKLDQESVAKIQKGVTTQEQVLSLVGSPDQMMRSSDGGTTFTYSYMRATPKPESFIPVVGMFVGGADVQNQMLMVTFDAKGIVSNITSTYGATESNMGLTAGSNPSLNDVEQNKRPAE